MNDTSMSDGQTTILLADDEPFNIDTVLEALAGKGFAIEVVHDGQAAWDLLESNPDDYDVVILDRMMPGLDGVAVLERIRRHPRLQGLPVILQTALASRENLLEGLRAGAYHYLTKPFDEDMLLSVLSTAVDDRLRYRRARQDSVAANRTFSLMEEGVFTLRTPDAARDLASTLANAFPDPQRAVIGLTELLLNAIEHGNLGISHAEKGCLREDGCWETEIERRLADSSNAQKMVSVRYRRGPGRIVVNIRDQGQGFDWHQYLEVDPARVFDPHGRGIALARLVSFDQVAYLGNGSEVEVIVVLPGDAASTAQATSEMTTGR